MTASLQLTHTISLSVVCLIYSDTADVINGVLNSVTDIQTPVDTADVINGVLNSVTDIQTPACCIVALFSCAHNG